MKRKIREMSPTTWHRRKFRAGVERGESIKSCRQRERIFQVLVERLFWSPHFPTADDDGGDAVADQVGEGATFAHETIYADEQGERFNRHAGHGHERGARATKPAPVTPLAPLDVIMAISSRLIWWLKSSGVFVAWARNTAAIAM